MRIVVDERNISDQLKQFWEFENLGVLSEAQEEHSFDEEIMKEFEAVESNIEPAGESAAGSSALEECQYRGLQRNS
ncbi:hypothetical protein AVEN_157030-2 [Araneus ventricosus]|nr:hypothetical protein AVEN_157030-2 [Araneus ventricosus]